ncbi:MAG: hypothetical protein ACK5GU_03495, partial [Chloroflexota bacterium]
MAYQRRNSLRLKGYAYGKGYYAVVILTAQRQQLLGEIVNQTMYRSQLGDVVNTMWLRIPEIHPHVTLDAYQIMPDHFHGIVILGQKKQVCTQNEAGALSDALTSGGGEIEVSRWNEAGALSDALTSGGGEIEVRARNQAGALSDALTSGGGEIEVRARNQAGALSDALTSGG